MTASECIKLLRENPDISMKQARKLTGLSRENVEKYAAYAGVTLRTAKNRREVCANKPYSCGFCPFADCIDKSPATPEETKMVSKALGEKKWED